MLKFIININHYNVLGGYLIVVGLITLISGLYMEKLVGYIVLLPLILSLLPMCVEFWSFRLPKAKIEKCLLPFILFVAWVLLSAIVKNTYGTEEFDNLLYYFLLTSCLPFLSGLITSRNIKFISNNMLIMIFILFSIMGAYQVIKNFEMIFYGRFRVSASASDLGANDFGSALGAYLFIVYENIRNLNTNGAYKYIIFIPLLAVAVVLIFLSGSMGNMISLILTLIIYISLRNKYNMPKAIMLILICLILSYFFSVIFMNVSNKIFSIFYNIETFGTENIFKYFTRIDSMRQGDIASIGGERIYYSNVFLQQFCDSPIFGSGFGSRLGLRNDPHNFVIELMGETGFVSLIIFLILTIFTLNSALNIIKNSRSLHAERFVAVFFIIAAISSLFSGSVYNNWYLWYLIGVLPIRNA